MSLVLVTLGAVACSGQDAGYIKPEPCQEAPAASGDFPLCVEAPLLAWTTTTALLEHDTSNDSYGPWMAAASRDGSRVGWESKTGVSAYLCPGRDLSVHWGNALEVVDAALVGDVMASVGHVRGDDVVRLDRSGTITGTVTVPGNAGGISLDPEGAFIAQSFVDDRPVFHRIAAGGAVVSVEPAIDGCTQLAGLLHEGLVVACHGPDGRYFAVGSSPETLGAVPPLCSPMRLYGSDPSHVWAVEPGVGLRHLTDAGWTIEPLPLQDGVAAAAPDGRVAYFGPTGFYVLRDGCWRSVDVLGAELPFDTSSEPIWLEGEDDLAWITGNSILVRVDFREGP